MYILAILYVVVSYECQLITLLSNDAHSLKIYSGRLEDRRSNMTLLIHFQFSIVNRNPLFQSQRVLRTLLMVAL